MRTLVDTCVLSDVKSKHGNPRVRECFAAMDAEDIYLSVLTLGELKKGIEKLGPSARKRDLVIWFDGIVLTSRERTLPIDSETAVVWGEVAAKSEKQGRPLPVIDGLLAATALRHGLHLMTRNVADFEATGVMLINPWD